MTCHPSVLNFLVESRIDGWGYGVAVKRISWFVRLAPGAYRNIELGLVTGIATLPFCPKLGRLPRLNVLFDQIITRRSA